MIQEKIITWFLACHTTDVPANGGVTVKYHNEQIALFNFTRRGDPVEVVNSPAKPKLYDPGMADWNVPWEQWKTTDVAA